MQLVKGTNEDKQVEKLQSKVWDPRILKAKKMKQQHDKVDG